MRIVKKLYQLTTQGNLRTVKVKRNIVFSFFSKGVGVLISLLLVPLTLGYLNDVDYGIWLTLSSIVTWINFFDIGLGNGLRNKLAEALAQNKLKLGQEYVSTTVALLMMIVVGIYILFYILNPFIPWNTFLNIPAGNTVNISTVMSAVVALFGLQFVFKFIGVILLADQKSSWNDALLTLSSLLSLIGIYALTRTTTGNLMNVALVFMASPIVIQFLICIFLFRKRYKALRPRLSSVRLSHSITLLGLGSQFLVMQVSGLIVFSTANVLISRLWGPEEVTPFNIAFRYFNVLTMFFSIVLSPLWTAYTHAYCSNDMSWIKRMIKISMGFWGLSVLVLIVMVIFANRAYALWVGPDMQISLALTVCVAVNTVIINWNSLFSPVVAGLGKIRLSMINSVANIILFIPLAVYMGNQFGTKGIVMSMSIILLLTTFWQPIQCWKLINRTARGWWNK